MELHFTFFILLAYFGYVGAQEGGWPGLVFSLLFIIGIFTCVVLHELGHSLSARGFGIRTHRILLLPIGGMAQFEGIPRQPTRELLITLAGPMVNFALVAILLPVVGWPSLDDLAAFQPAVLLLFQALLVVNLVMGVFNLLPIFPMDGGRIFRALLAYRFSYLTATRWAVLTGKILATAGALAALFYFGNFLLAILFAFIFLGGEMEYRMVRRQEELRGLYIRDFLEQPEETVSPGQTLGGVWRQLIRRDPRDLLVMDEEHCFGVLHAETLRHSLLPEYLAKQVGEVCLHPVTRLQSDWPLEPFYVSLLQGRQRLYPVYHGGRLIGVLHTKDLEEKIEWARARARALRQMGF